jgi:beta-galactosidase
MKPAVGVCYYPEHWPVEMWQADAERMVASGIQWVRIGEFAWSRIEAQPGHFTWDWLDQAIGVLGRAGLKIVLGTPTATPPRWMTDKHPDMLAVDQDGRPRGFGSRRHYDFSHPGYRAESKRICRLLAQRYGQNPHIGFWQTDNEYSCHDTTLSYSAAALSGFRSWLQEKYQTIDTLNAAWGNVFWSMEYRDFTEIALPNLTVTEANPAHWHDFRRYSSAQVVLFNRVQVEAIREFDPHTPILHNYMGRITDFDHFAVGNDLDAASWDSYPLGFLEDRSEEGDAWKRQYMRQGDPDFQAFHHDLYRAVGKGRWWVMEQQPGPVNWAPYNPAPLPGMVRLWGWEAVAHGAEVVSYFRWRQAPFAQEQQHAGLLRPDNQPAPGLAEAQQLAEEISAYDETTVTAPVAIVFDYESDWAWQTQPQGKGFSYFRLVFEYYRALRKLGLSVDICPPETTDFSAYKLVLVPGLMHWKAGLQQALADCSAQLLLGPRTGSRTAEFSIPAHLAPDCPDLIDLQVSHVESLRPDAGIELQGGGMIQHWHEFLEPGANVENVLVSAEHEQAVLVRQNNVHYLGGQLDQAGYARVLTALCTAGGLHTCALPEGLRLRQWGRKMVAVNYSAQAVSLDALAAYGFTGELAAAGVMVLP